MRYMPIAALATIAVAAGTAVIAQAPQAAPAGAHADRAARWEAHKADFEAMRKRRADDIALLIGLRADQRPAFDAMEAAMMPKHRPGEGPDGGPGGGPDSGRPPMPPQDESMAARLDHMSARIDERSTEAKARLTALKTFYAGLSPEQKLRFDALDRLRHDHGPMGRHGGPRRPGGWAEQDGPDGPPPPPMG